MSDIYGAGLNGARVYTQYTRNKVQDANALTKTLGTLDPNKAEDISRITELQNRISETKIAIDYANDVLSLILKLTQLPT